jgi:hypothetical protein
LSPEVQLACELDPLADAELGDATVQEFAHVGLVDSEERGEFLLREAALLDVQEPLAIDLAHDLDLKGLGGAEAKIIEHVAAGQMGCLITVFQASLLSQSLLHMLSAPFGDRQVSPVGFSL